jgi:Tfp pilus assembly protein PilF
MPGNYLALTTRAEVYLVLGTPRLALQDLQAAILLRPDDPETLRMLSRAFKELGDHENAEKYYRQATATSDGKV